MDNEILTYLEMCQREGANLQRGMNFRMRGDHSVTLMSVRPNSPYADRLEDDGDTLIYEGHDVPQTSDYPEPKRVDQPERTPRGSLTENGKFHQAAQAFKTANALPERVRVYEKLKKGIWSYNGVFHLVDSWMETAGERQVFKFKLIAVADDEDFTQPVRREMPHRRIIPSWVKVEVWRRDGGKCVECGATDELHFDHELPYAKGGTSLTPENVQLLCARHNIAKRDRII